MINPVSFGSTYKAYASSHNIKKQDSFNKLMTFCESKDLKHETKITSMPVMVPDQISEQLTTLTVVTPDNFDERFESYCASRGIQVEKYVHSDIMTPQSILSRIQTPPLGYKKALVDADKLSEFLKNQPDNNFEHCEKDYQEYYKDRVNFMLKSADKIPAPSLYINTCSGKKRTLEFIRTYGSDKINPNSIITDLSQRTIDPDHCLFFAMRDAGLKQIPVYVNRDSYDIGHALGLLK